MWREKERKETKTHTRNRIPTSPDSATSKTPKQTHRRTQSAGKARWPLLVAGRWQKVIKPGSIGEVHYLEHASGAVAGVKFFPWEAEAGS